MIILDLSSHVQGCYNIPNRIDYTKCSWSKYFFLQSSLIRVNHFLNYFKGEIPAELKEPAVALHALCQQQSGVSEDVIQAAGNNNFMDDQALKCYLKCVWETMGAVSIS